MWGEKKSNVICKRVVRHEILENAGDRATRYALGIGQSTSRAVANNAIPTYNESFDD